MQKDDDCGNKPGSSNSFTEESEAVSSDKLLEKARVDDLKVAKESPMSPEEARKLADEVIAKMKAGKKPGELYDEYRPDTQIALPHSRRSKKSAMQAIQDENGETAPEERGFFSEGVRLATLAFFTLMALLGFMCTYLLVYVVEPMTRKEQEELMKQARAAGYDLPFNGDTYLFFKSFIALFIIPALICFCSWRYRNI